MFGHPLELIIVLVLALIFFGPEKLPEVAASAGKFVRDMRASFDSALNPEETMLPDDFSTYYYESMERSGEEMAAVEELPDPADDDIDYAHTGSDEYDDPFHAGDVDTWQEDANRAAPETATGVIANPGSQPAGEPEHPPGEHA